MAEPKKVRDILAALPEMNLVLLNKTVANNKLRIRVRASNGIESSFRFPVRESSDPHGLANDLGELKRFSRRNTLVVSVDLRPKKDPADLSVSVAAPAPAAATFTPEAPAPTPAPTPALTSAPAEVPPMPEPQPELPASPSRRRAHLDDVVVLTDFLRLLTAEERVTTVKDLTATLSYVLSKPVSESTVKRLLAATGVVLTAPPVVEPPKRPSIQAQIRTLAQALEGLYQHSSIQVPQDLAVLVEVLKS